MKIKHILNHHPEKNAIVLLNTPPKTNMTMEKPPFEDVSPIKNCVFPLSC